MGFLELRSRSGQLFANFPRGEDGIKDEETVEIWRKAHSGSLAEVNKNLVRDLEDLNEYAHEKDKDTYLDKGGANQVTAADAKDAVAKKHSSYLWGTKELDESNIGDTKHLEYTASSGKWECVDKPSGWSPLISDIEVAEDCDYIDFTNLDGNSDGGYDLLVSLANPLGSSVTYYLQVNGDSTVAHYYLQYMGADGTTVGAARFNDSRLHTLSANGEATSFSVIMRDGEGYFRAISLESRYLATCHIVTRFIVKADAIINNITSLRILADTSNGIGEGSRLILMRHI